MVRDMLTREFQGETANALGKGGDKIEALLSELRVAGEAVAVLGPAGGAPKLSAITAYNALWKAASSARQNLVIQREAAGMGGGATHQGGSSMRVDVIKGSMRAGPAGGDSAEETVRKLYPLPQRMGKDGSFVATAAEAYTG